MNTQDIVEAGDKLVQMLIQDITTGGYDLAEYTKDEIVIFRAKLFQYKLEKDVEGMK